MSILNFRTITVVVGPEIDEWLERQEALDRADDERDLVRWWNAYRLLGGAKTFQVLARRRRPVSAPRRSAGLEIRMGDLE